MKETRSLMGMTITLEIVDPGVHDDSINKVFEYLKCIDEKFSTYKETSEISAINRGEIEIQNSSSDMETIFYLANETKIETNGYFDIKKPDGKFDPSGIVKGWAIYNASQILNYLGHKNFYIDLGGDIQTYGKNKKKEDWKLGIRDPWKHENIVKTVSGKNLAMATSGTYERGNHIYNPKTKENNFDIVSFSVIGPDIFEADRFATAAFAMGREGINFIENLVGFEGYMIDNKGIATETSGFKNYVKY